MCFSLRLDSGLPRPQAHLDAHALRLQSLQTSGCKDQGMLVQANVFVAGVILTRWARGIIYERARSYSQDQFILTQVTISYFDSQQCSLLLVTLRLLGQPSQCQAYPRFPLLNAAGWHWRPSIRRLLIQGGREKNIETPSGFGRNLFR